MPTTPLNQIPYPLPGDAADVPADIKRVADRLDSFGYVPIGGIILWPLPGGSPSPNFLVCDGAPVPAGFPLLLAKMANTPNTQGLFPIGAGTRSGSGGSYNYSTGTTGGFEKITLALGELPAHHHSYTDYFPLDNYNTPGSGAGGGSQNAIRQTGDAGSGQAHENRPPWFVFTFLIRAA